MYSYQFETLALVLQLLFLAEFSSLLKVMSEGSKSTREATTNGLSHHTISVAPSYMTLYPRITQIGFQCYVDTRPAKDGQIFWTRNGLSLSCNKTNRVFACQNILLITKAVFEDAGKYICILNDNSSIYYTVAVVVPVFILNPRDETVTLSRGEGRLLDCGVSNSSYPPAKSVDWKHNDTWIDSGPTLQLRGMDQNETGVYECTAFNGYGIPTSKKFYVSVDGVGETIRSPTVPLTTVPTSAIQNDRVTDDVRVEGDNTAISASASQVFHPFCLFLMVLCLINQGFEHLMY